MKETMPYGHAVPAEAIAAASAGTLLDDALFTVRVSGELTLAPGAGPNVLRLLDEHPVLGRMLAVGLGRLYVRRSTIEVSPNAWAQIRRGLLLCASEASEGELRVEHGDVWAQTFAASGDSPRSAMKTTAQMPTARYLRPKKKR